MSSPFLLNLISVDISNLTGQITCQYAQSRHSVYNRYPYLGSGYSGTIFITYFGHIEYYADPCNTFCLHRICAEGLCTSCAKTDYWPNPPHTCYRHS